MTTPEEKRECRMRAYQINKRVTTLIHIRDALAHRCGYQPGDTAHDALNQAIVAYSADADRFAEQGKVTQAIKL